MMGGITQKLLADSIEAYKRDLAKHDWSYAMSDDYSAYQAGARARAALAQQRAMYDKDGAIWNSICPVWARMPVPATPES